MKRFVTNSHSKDHVLVHVLHVGIAGFLTVTSRFNSNSDVPGEIYNDFISANNSDSSGISHRWQYRYRISIPYASTSTRWKLDQLFARPILHQYFLLFKLCRMRQSCGHEIKDLWRRSIPAISHLVRIPVCA